MKWYSFDFNDVKADLDKKYQFAIDEELKIIQSYINVKSTKKPLISFQWATNYKFEAKSRVTDLNEDKYQIIIDYTIPYLLENNIIDVCKISDEYATQIIILIIKMILWHESMHILFGHCTISETDYNHFSNDIKKKFEVMCDLKGLDNMLSSFDNPLMAVIETNNHLEICNEKIKRYTYYASLISSLFIYYHIMEVKDSNSNTSSLNSKRTHPFSTFRFEYLLKLIEMHLLNEKCAVPSCNKDEMEFIYAQSNRQLSSFGFDEERFEINPLEGENIQELLELLNIDYDDMKMHVKKCYID